MSIGWGCVPSCPTRRAAVRLFVHEALTSDPVAPPAVAWRGRRWLALRMERSEAAAARFHGAAASYRPAAYSVSSLERYLQCPFRFFAERVLKLEEDPEDEATLNPKELGIFVHEVFQKFFEEWNRRGHRGITPENLPAGARRFSARSSSRYSRTLPEDEAAVQRTRLLGSAVDEGLAEAVFQAEAEWETPVVERLLEHSLEGEFDIQDEDGDAAHCAARKSRSHRPSRRQDVPHHRLQAQPRARSEAGAAAADLHGLHRAASAPDARREEWEPGQAGYIAFGQERQFVPMLARGKSKDATLVDGAGAPARCGRPDRARRISADARRHHDVHPLRARRRVPEGLRWRRLTGCRSGMRGRPKSRRVYFPGVGSRKCLPERFRELPDAAARERAVDPAHNVVLEASAGTGKTHVLVDRYLNLLSKGVDPANILAITFTRKAAAEMREPHPCRSCQSARIPSFDKLSTP